MEGQTAGVTPWRRYPLIYQQAAPAAGAEARATVPGGQRWNVLGILGRLVASAAVANRVPSLTVSTGNSVFTRLPAPVTVTAGQTRTFQWFPEAYAVNDGSIYQAVLPKLVLDAGAVIATSTGAIDVGDQWDALWLNLLVEDVQYGADELTNYLARILAGQGEG